MMPKSDIYKVLLIMICMIPFSWYHIDSIISIADFVFSFNISEFYPIPIYTWNDLSGFGYVNSQLLPFLVVSSILRLINFLIVPVGLTQLFFFSGLMLIGVFGIYKLTGIYFNNEDIPYFSSLIFILNPYVITRLFGHLDFAILIYYLFPLIIYFFIKISTNKFKMKYIIIFLLLILLLSSNCNPLFSIQFFILFSLFLIFYHKKIKIKNVFTLLVLIILVTSFFTIPLIFSLDTHLHRQIDNTIEFYGDNINTLKITSQKSDILNILALKGYWTLYSKYAEFDYFSYSSLYTENPFFVIIGLVPFAIILLGLICYKDFKNNQNLFINILLLNLILMIFLIKGLKEPFGNAFYSAIMSYDLGQVFRTVYDKFGASVVFSYSILFGISMSILISKINKSNMKIFFIITMSFLIFLNAFPFFTGDIISNPDDDVMPTGWVHIPKYYSEFKSYMEKTNDNYRIYPFPPTYRQWGVFLDWNQTRYGGGDPFWLYLKKPIITSTNHPLAMKALDLIESNNKEHIEGFFKLTGVKYILFYRDSNWKYYKYSPSIQSKLFYENYLSKLNSYEEIIYFEKLKLYKLDYDIYDYVYYTDNFYEYSDFDDLFNKAKIKSKNQLFLNYNQTDIKLLNIDKYNNVSSSNESKEAKFIKVSPVEIYIQNSSNNNNFLVFNEGFDSNWKAYVYSNTKKFNWYDVFWEKQIDDKYHFEANGYANGWFLNNSEICNNLYGITEEQMETSSCKYTITLYFKPQSYFYLGLILSGMTFIFCIGYSILIAIRANK